METKTKVEIKKDDTFEDNPIRFWIHVTMLDILEIEDRWYSENFFYFKVFANNAKHYLLKKSNSDGIWTVKELFAK
jgi:hypothetical protein